MTVKLVLFLALMGLALGQRFSPPSLELDSLNEEISDSEVIATAAGVAAAIAVGAPVNATDAIAEAIIAANSNTDANAAGIAAAIFTGVPIDETAAIARNIAIAAAENASIPDSIEAVASIDPIRVVDATEAFQSLLMAPSNIHVCPEKPKFKFCSVQERAQRWFKSCEGICKPFRACASEDFNEGFADPSECRRTRCRCTRN